MLRKNFIRVLFLLCALIVGSESVRAEEVTYTISSKNTLTTTGTAPTGSSATIEETYNTSKQMTSGNSQTLTLKGYNGCTISKIVLSMKSNASSGAGKLRYSTDGGSTYTYIVGSSNSGVYFNNNSWYGNWSSSYVNITKDVSIECSNSDVIIKIEATGNSIYCQSYKLTYTAPIAHNITATSSNESHGTVSLAGNVITATPAVGYRVSTSTPYTITSGEENVSNVAQNGNVFTITATGDCGICINFEAIPTHTVTWSVNNNTSEGTVAEGEVIDFPNNPDDINGMTFVGWVTEAIIGSTDDEPTFVTSATMGDSDVTYYAVFANVNSTTEELTKSYGFETESDANWIIDGPERSSSYHNTGNYSGKINTNNSYVTFKHKVKVKEFSFAFTRTSTNANYNVFIETSTDNSTWTKVETYAMSSFNNDGTFSTRSHTFDGSTENYVRFHCNNTTAERYVDDVTIIYENEATDISGYCTTVSALPHPEMTMEDVEMTWGETGKSVTPTATIGGEPYNGTFSFSCDDTNMSVNPTTGELSCNVPGYYTITATIAATEEHQAAQTTCTVTVNKKDITLSFANEEVIKMTTDENKTFTETATADPTAYDGTITYTIDGNGGASIEPSTGAVTFTDATGINTITATASETTLYHSNTASYKLYVKTIPTITVSDQVLAYGATYTPTITGGEAIFTCVPDGMITSDGNVITAAVVGTSTITVTTAANDTYVAGEASFTLTTTAPEGLTETPGTEDVTVFYESFNSNNSSGGNDNKWSGTIATGGAVFNNTGWGHDKASAANKCIKLGTGSAGGYVETPALALESGSTYTLSFKAAAWNSSSEGTTLSLSATNAKLSQKSVTLTKGAWTDYEVTVTNASNNARIKFYTSNGNNRFFLDEVKLTCPGNPIGSVPATIANSGYGSYCSEYPLNLPADNEDYKAYIVTNVTGSTVTFTQISGEIKGGVPFFLYGTPGNYDLPTAASSDIIPANNMLQGTLAPTYISTVNGEYTNFGLNQGFFRKINNGILPAHKAYLPILTSKVPTGSEARMTIVFDDETTTGVSDAERLNDNGEMINDNIHDLQGRKVTQLKKGLYIVNGKKIFVK